MWLLDWFSSALDGKYLFKVFIVKMRKVHPNQSVLCFLACTSLCTKQASMASDRVELTTVQLLRIVASVLLFFGYVWCSIPQLHICNAWIQWFSVVNCLGVFLSECAGGSYCAVHVWCHYVRSLNGAFLTIQPEHPCSANAIHLFPKCTWNLLAVGWECD